MTDPNGGFYNGYTLGTGPDISPKTLVAQAGTIRGLLAAYQVTNNVAYKEAAIAGYTYLKSNFWNSTAKTFLSEKGAVTATYTPNNVAAVAGMLRELYLAAGDASTSQTYVDFFNTVVNGGMQQSEMMPTGETGGDSDGDGIPFITEGDGTYGIAPVIAGEATLVITSVDVDNIASNFPTKYRLSQNYPNPFNPQTIIHYDLPMATPTRLTVYDLLGREMVRLVDNYMEPGNHEAHWNGRDRFGHSLPAGIYIARLATPEYSKSIKLVLLK